MDPLMAKMAADKALEAKNKPEAPNASPKPKLEAENPSAENKEKGPHAAPKPKPGGPGNGSDDLLKNLEKVAASVVKLGKDALGLGGGPSSGGGNIMNAAMKPCSGVMRGIGGPEQKNENTPNAPENISKPPKTPFSMECKPEKK